MFTRQESRRKRLFSLEPEICIERALTYTRVFEATEGKPIIVRRAKAFASTVQEMSIYIGEDELIVGNLAIKPRAAPIFPEFGVEWIEEELESFSHRSVDRFLIDEQKKRQLKSICRYWRGKTHFTRCSSLLSLILSHVLKGPGSRGYLHPSINEVCWMTDHIYSGDGHVIPDYENVLSQGLNGVMNKAREELNGLDYNDPKSLEKAVFLQSVIISLNAAIEFGKRFASKARELAVKEDKRERKNELEKIAEICERVPANPPRSFYEALQMCWFLHLMVQIESNGHSISLGRFDQYLWPYYQQDIKEGRITRDKARELIECFFIKCSECSKLRDWGTTQAQSGYPLYQALTLGGQTEFGEDATNALSYICLEATAHMKLYIPSVMVRIHAATPQEFLIASCKALVEHGGGLPAFFNDEVAIPMLCSIGVDLKDARNWAVMGCCEVRVPGKHCTSHTSLQINLLKVLEIALNDGINPNTGIRLLPGNGDLSTFASYEDILHEFERQLAFYMRFLPICEKIIRSTYAELTPTPFLSSLILFRIEEGKDVSEGGGPNYNDTLVPGHGIPDVANSLAVIKKLIFGDKKLDLGELKETLANDFKGDRGSQILAMVKKVPKYGVDYDYVDSIAAWVFRLFAETVRKYTPVGGGVFGPTAQTLTMNALGGEVVGATPDGRRTGEALADNLSPAAGTDTKGPTAVYKSVSKLDHVLTNDGVILNLKFHPTAVKGESEITKFAQAIRTYFINLHGFQVQFNIVSSETLKDAQKNPEKYQNLIVKVAGYSARFADLEKPFQDLLIARTEHTKN